MNGQAESDISIVGPTTSSAPGMMRPQELSSSVGGMPNQLQLPQALQNLQRILQSQLGNVNPMHLQRALQKQQVIFNPCEVIKIKIVEGGRRIIMLIIDKR